MALLSFVCALYLSLHASWFSWLFILLAVWLAWDALRNGTVWHGFHAFRDGDIRAVRKAMLQIRRPNMLSPQSLAYYHWLKGVVDMADNRFAAAKVHLLVAASGSLRTENDRSLVHCLLAEVGLQEQEPEVAREHLRHARALQHRPDVDRIIDNLSARLGG
ncbi:MAG: hypothetical protein R6X15_01290 [Pseudomonadota bacterium]